MLCQFLCETLITHENRTYYNNHRTEDGACLVLYMPQATIVVVGLMVRNFKNLGGVSMYTYLAYKLSNKKMNDFWEHFAA